jgi:beta-glucosidase
MTMGRPPAIVRGTGGIGDVFERKIPSPQTADGPAGVRSVEPTHCFPCATLLACSWDVEMVFNVGAAIAKDALAMGVDILLAPGLNIHRNPSCGRNFEYYSEDPLLSGKIAAAYVRGVQSKGIGATIKHFALNNKEENRYESNSIVGERALREIYLKGFEIAIKESNPWCVMTSYNLINGVRASMNEKLIRGVLRGEWGYDGMIMTDWRVHSHLWQEIKAGSNVKMPFGYPEEIQMTKNAYAKGIITREMLEESAKYVLKTVLKTKRFR